MSPKMFMYFRVYFCFWVLFFSFFFLLFFKSIGPCSLQSNYGLHVTKLVCIETCIQTSLCKCEPSVAVTEDVLLTGRVNMPLACTS